MIKESIKLLIRIFLSIGVYKIINFFKIQYRTFELIKLKKKFKFIGSNINIQSNFIVHNPQYISIGDNFSSLYNLRIEAIDIYQNVQFVPEINIGNNVNFNSDIHIGCINKVQIGDNVLLASRIFITDHSHGNCLADENNIAPFARKLTSKGPVIIESNVWIGEGVTILAGVTIGKNSIVGSNSVVNKSFPPNSIIAGIPAKVIKKI